MANHHVNFGPVTLAVGEHTFGPVTISVNTGVLITIQRDTPGGLSSLGSDTTLAVQIQSSSDGGATWNNEDALTTTGGALANRHGPVLTNTLNETGLDQGKNRVQLIVTIGGPSSVALSGSIDIN